MAGAFWQTCRRVLDDDVTSKVAGAAKLRVMQEARVITSDRLEARMVSRWSASTLSKSCEWPGIGSKLCQQTDDIAGPGRLIYPRLFLQLAS